MLNQLRILLKNWLVRPETPGPLYIIIGRKEMASVFRIKVLLPPIVDLDVEKREFTYKIGEDAAVVSEVAKDAPSVEILVPQNATVHLSLVDIDDAGNRSVPSERDFTALDTVPPAQPGQLGVEVVAEEHV